ncbi:hypothetical protein Hanom_Chr06g00513021 [Helianthus anomalus]
MGMTFCFYFYKSKVHGRSLWFTKILDLIPNFSKVHEWSPWFALCNTSST